MSGAHKTVVAAAACLAMAPAAVYAAEEVATVISDPHDPSARARVTLDGRLGVRGDVGTHPVIPVHTFRSGFHSYARTTGTYPNLQGNQVWCCTRPGASLALSQWSATHQAPTLGQVAVRLHARPAVGGTCDTRLDASFFDVVSEMSVEAGDSSRQMTFPVPLTVDPRNSDQGVCLVASQSGQRTVSVGVSGLTGPRATEFEAPTGKLGG